jgi:acyl-CoA thioesterase
MDSKVKEAFHRQVEKEPFAKMLGLSLIDGGAIFTLIDEAFEISCNSHGTVAVALNVNITYHRAPSAKSTLRAEAKEVSRTRKTGNYYITVKDDKDNLIASCQALAYRKGEKLPFLE